MPRKSRKNNQQVKTPVVIIGVLLTFFLFSLLAPQQKPSDEIKFHEFLEATNLPENDVNRIVEVTFQEDEITGLRANQESFKTIGKYDAELRKELQQKGVRVSFKKPEEPHWLKSILINSIPFILLIVIFMFVMRQLQVGGGKAMSFGKSRAKMLNESQTKVTFKDVAGVDEALNELEEIIDFLKEPKKFTKLGGRIPKGVLLVGPPGTGKTILAKAIAGEAGVPFFSISGSDFVEMFVGVGASRVRDLFEQAKKNAPCIIFIDEIDAVGRQRGAGMGGGHDEREQTLNQLLVEMDGFETNEGVILIAATNRVDVLDPALLRPGRFDRRVIVPKPDIKGREAILAVHTRNTPLESDIDLKTLAQGTPGFSGADLENMVNEAALIAARSSCEKITNKHLEQAKDKVMMGPERKSMIISEAEKKHTAYHESGHALVAKLVKGADPVHKMSIIPRGQALGVTILLPESERLTLNQEYAEGIIAYAMGGRAAEELIFGQVTNGAYDDIKKATDIARKMVCEWGMSESLGPINFSEGGSEVFMGRDFGHTRNFSEKVSESIDLEVKDIVNRNYQRALTLLRDNRNVLEEMSETLLIREVIDRKEIDDLVAGKKLLTEDEKKAYYDKVNSNLAATNAEEEKPVEQ